MKSLASYIIAFVFASFGMMTDAGSNSSDEFVSEKVDCEQNCPDFNDADANCSKVCSEGNFVDCDYDEGYVDDIPFDTGEVIENIDEYETDSNAENKKDDEVTIFELFIKWVSLLFRLN